MGRTAVITQPTYLPWLGYFEQIARADVFVFLDTVQFVKRSWHSRNRLKGSQGEPFWMTVPVMAHSQTARLLEIRISPGQSNWQRKHLRSIQMQLGAAPHFQAVFPFVEKWLGVGYGYLVDLNIAGIKMLSEVLGLAPQFVRASELISDGNKSRLLVSLCKSVGADHYYSAAGSKEYMEAEEEKRCFDEAGIQVTYQSWKHPSYPQQGNGFVSHLSVLDALMNIGPQATRALITGAGAERVNG